ncbi:MAG TPA: WXG100 family type VII secretion target [Actinopolymorphaceae bacterium]
MSGTNTHNAGDIKASADRIDESASTINGLKTAIDGHRQALQTHWKGASSGTFAKVMTVYDEELTKVLASLEDIHEKLVHSKIQYESNEQQSTEAVSAIEAALSA